MYETIIFISILFLTALINAADQITRYPDRFLPVSRLPVAFYDWDWRFKLPLFREVPLDAKHFYQGISITGFAIDLWYAGYYLYSSWWLIAIWIIIWWVILRNFSLHTILTRDERILNPKTRRTA